MLIKKDQEKEMSFYSEDGISDKKIDNIYQNETIKSLNEK